MFILLLYSTSKHTNKRVVNERMERRRDYTFICFLMIAGLFLASNTGRVGKSVLCMKEPVSYALTGDKYGWNLNQFFNSLMKVAFKRGFLKYFSDIFFFTDFTKLLCWMQSFWRFKCRNRLRRMAIYCSFSTSRFPVNSMECMQPAPLGMLSSLLLIPGI